MPTVRRRIADAENVILESNSILKFVRPDLYLTVLDPENPDFKKSAQEFLDRADAVILHNPTDRIASETCVAGSLAEASRREARRFRFIRQNI